MLDPFLLAQFQHVPDMAPAAFTRETLRRVVAAQRQRQFRHAVGIGLLMLLVVALVPISELLRVPALAVVALARLLALPWAPAVVLVVLVMFGNLARTLAGNWR